MLLIGCFSGRFEIAWSVCLGQSVGSLQAKRRFGTGEAALCCGLKKYENDDRRVTFFYLMQIIWDNWLAFNIFLYLCPQIKNH